MTELWPLVVVEGIVLAIFAFIPVIRGEHAFFGVPVARDFYDGEGQRILRRYRLALLAIFGVFALAGVYFLHTATVLPIAATVPILGVLLVYAKAFARVRTFRVASSQTRFRERTTPR